MKRFKHPLCAARSAPVNSPVSCQSGRPALFWPALAIALLSCAGWPMAGIASDTGHADHADHANHADHQHEQHGAHSHGVGTLNVALDEHTLMIELRVPAMHVVGFEHAPATPAEHAAVDAALAAGHESGHWVQPDVAAACTAQDADVHLGDEHDGEHSDYEAVYTFECTRPEALATIRFAGFARLQGIESLNARFVTPNRQGAQTLHAGHPELQLLH